MTDAEIIAYNAGIRAYHALGDIWFTETDLRRSLGTVMEAREQKSLDRLGDAVFIGWAMNGAWDARAKVAR